MKLSFVGRLLSALGVAVLATVYAAPASALSLPFSQTTGFHEPTATANTVAGRGGLEFSAAVTAPPGAPLGDGSAPANIWRGVAWGCEGGNITPATCANGGAVGHEVGGPDEFANPFRSALRILGQFGTLTDAGFTDITLLSHHNNPIDGNTLLTVAIRSLLRLGTVGVIVDDPAPSIVNLDFNETINGSSCTEVAAPGAPVNPLGTACDDFAVIDSLDLTSVFIPAGFDGPSSPAMIVDFQLDARSAAALVCDGKADQPVACGSYPGPNIIIFTGEGSTNELAVQAKLRPADVGQPLPLFVIGDVEPHAVKDVVNFWGAQWWKNNQMSGFVSKGVASFKGYANHAEDFCGGVWESRPGNSSEPPATIPDPVAIIVTDTVVKNGPNISGTIKQILLVDHDGKYGPNPGHRGSGPVVKVLCTAR